MPYRNLEEGVYVAGLQDMQRVLKRAEHELAPELRRRLAIAGTTVRAVAHANAPVGVRSARYRFGGVDLRDSIKVSVTQRSASVYSTAVYGGVQNYGGRVGRNHATVLARGQVSQYMTRAVQSEKANTTRQIEGILDWLQQELN